jgi:hypothetical protein
MNICQSSASMNCPSNSLGEVVTPLPMKAASPNALDLNTRVKEGALVAFEPLTGSVGL